MSSVNWTKIAAVGEIAFETGDFYLACFLRCIGYELLDLRAEGRRKVFVFQDRGTRRDDVMAFYGDAISVRPLAFAATIKDMRLKRKPHRTSSAPKRSARPSTGLKG